MKQNKFLSMLLIAIALTGCATPKPNNNNQDPNANTNQPAQNGYVRVTSNLDDFSGEYLIVENNGYYLNAAAHFDSNNAEYNEKAEINNDCIERRKDGKYSFTITKNNNGTYKIASTHTGQVMGASSSSSLSANASFANTINIANDGHAIIKCNGFALRYNGEDFRYYVKDNIFDNIYLFKY